MVLPSERGKARKRGDTPVLDHFQNQETLNNLLEGVRSQLGYQSVCILMMVPSLLNVPCLVVSSRARFPVDSRLKKLSYCLL